MSLRINKTMGYTLTVPYESLAHIANIEGIDSKPMTDYMDFLGDRYKRHHTHGDKREFASDLNDARYTVGTATIAQLTASDVIRIASTVDDESENTEVTIIIVPLSMHKQWHHHDDYIDAAEWDSQSGGYPNGGLSPRLTDVKAHSLFPYDGNHMDARTGKEFLNSSMVNFAQKMINDSPDNKQKDNLLNIIMEAGFQSWEEFEEFYVPAIPGPVRDLVDWLGLFTDVDTWLKLRPKIVAYWS